MDLDEDDIRVVYDILHAARAKWYEIGLQLGVKSADLDAIRLESNNHLLDMLKRWLRFPSATWPDIVEALRRPSVNDLHLARRVNNRHCPDYRPRELSLDPHQIRRLRETQPSPPNINGRNEGTPGPDQGGTSRPSSANHEIGTQRRRLTRWEFAGISAVIVLCIGFAFGGITLIAVGIRGFNDDEDYTCSLGPPDAFNALNLLTGVVFLSGVVIIVLFIFYISCKHIERVITGIIIGVIASSLIFILVDMIYSFYVASQLLPEVQRWEENKSLCGEAVFRSAFGIVVTYFLLTTAVVITGAVLLSRLLFHYSRPLRQRISNCFDSN